MARGPLPGPAMSTARRTLIHPTYEPLRTCRSCGPKRLERPRPTSELGWPEGRLVGNIDDDVGATLGDVHAQASVAGHPKPLRKNPCIAHEDGRFFTAIAILVRRIKAPQLLPLTILLGERTDRGLVRVPVNHRLRGSQSQSWPGPPWDS